MIWVGVRSLFQLATVAQLERFAAHISWLHLTQSRKVAIL
jgi:hypothetical protein